MTFAGLCDNDNLVPIVRGDWHTLKYSSTCRKSREKKWQINLEPTSRTVVVSSSLVAATNATIKKPPSVDFGNVMDLHLVT